MQGSPEDPDKYDNNPIATHLRRHPDLHKDYQEKRNACERPSKLKGASKASGQQPSIADSFKPKMKASAPKAPTDDKNDSSLCSSWYAPLQHCRRTGFPRHDEVRYAGLCPAVSDNVL
ncbi:hypothetical protein HPB49_006044 [Dermacentor silvarum]|uniref:Uncharacterized protein n=1 Tax=Dermacentor silvarum TaxID=543639 RepID=A0ACB8CDP2_DERSI|nr:hypothetical protein HPB49_006044 [Dermacentor silvarum]